MRISDWSLDVCSSDLSDIRQFEIDDMGHARHVNPARSNVGRDQQLDATLAERLQRRSSLALALVAMDGDSLHACAFQKATDAVGAILRAGESQRTVNRLPLYGERQKRLLLDRKTT